MVDERVLGLVGSMSSRSGTVLSVGAPGLTVSESVSWFRSVRIEGACARSVGGCSPKAMPPKISPHPRASLVGRDRSVTADEVFLVWRLSAAIAAQ